MNIDSAKWKILGLFGGMGGAFIVLVGGILLRVWFAPDVRYEPGSYYRGKSVAVTSLKLQNHGHGDAEDITVRAHFEEPVVELQTNDAALPFQVIDGGPGSKTVIGRIDRLVPGQVVYIYFSIRAPDAPVPGESADFVSSITLKGSHAKTGEPRLFNALGYGSLIFIVYTTLGLMFLKVVRDRPHLFPGRILGIGMAFQFGHRKRQSGTPPDEFERF